jgi:hypothetical protein
MTLKQIASVLGVLAVLAIIFGLWASHTKPVAAPAAQETHILQGTKTAQGDYLYTEDKDYYSIKAAYPGQTGLKAEADAIARATIEQGLADEIANFKKNSGLDALTPQDIQTQGLGGDRKYMLDMEYKAYSSTSSVSYAYTVYADTLGAHPNGYYLTFVFDSGGNQAELGDLFADGSDYLARIASAATAQVTKQLQAGLNQQDVSESIFKEGLAPKDENFKNFVIDGDTLVVFIPPYQVAAYVAGSFEVRIPLSTLADILAPGVR